MPEGTAKLGEDAIRIARWRASGVPLRHRRVVEAGMTFESFDEPEAARKVAAGVKRGGLVLLLGDFGSGKTQLAAWLIWAVCVHGGKLAMYRRFADLLSEMRQECYTRGGSDAELFARLSRVGLLVLDELHHRRWSEDENLWLLRLLDHRYGAETPTIAIANLSRSAAGSALDGSIIDRLRDGGAVVEMRGPSRRGRAAGVSS